MELELMQENLNYEGKYSILNLKLGNEGLKCNNGEILNE